MLTLPEKKKIIQKARNWTNLNGYKEITRQFPSFFNDLGSKYVKLDGLKKKWIRLRDDFCTAPDSACICEYSPHYIEIVEGQIEPLVKEIEEMYKTRNEIYTMVFRKQVHVERDIVLAKQKYKQTKHLTNETPTV